jgi:hypothetical protein
MRQLWRHDRDKDDSAAEARRETNNQFRKSRHRQVGDCEENADDS